MLCQNDYNSGSVIKRREAYFNRDEGILTIKEYEVFPAGINGQPCMPRLVDTKIIHDICLVEDG